MMPEIFFSLSLSAHFLLYLVTAVGLRWMYPAVPTLQRLFLCGIYRIASSFFCAFIMF